MLFFMSSPTKMLAPQEKDSLLIYTLVPGIVVGKVIVQYIFTKWCKISTHN